MSQRQFRSDDTSKWLEKYGNKSDGAYAPSTGTEAPVDSACTGTINTTSLSATNASFAIGQLILIHQSRGTGAGQWELNKIADYTAGTITTSYSLIYDYVSGAQVRVLNQYSSALVDTGVTLSVKAWTGSVGGILAILCNGAITISGTIQGSGLDANYVAGGAAASSPQGRGFWGGDGPATSTAKTGEGTAGAITTGTSANGNGGGGVSGIDGSAGGGGNGTAGTAGTIGAAGASAGNAGLTSMVFGGGGGGAGSASDFHNSGAGGGAIVILIGKTITLGSSSSINVNGGLAVGAQVSGGSGAGGSILFKGKEIVLNTAKATALKGDSTSVGDGGDGRVHADYATSISGTTSPTIDSRQDSSLNTDTGMLLVF